MSEASGQKSCIPDSRTRPHTRAPAKARFTRKRISHPANLVKFFEPNTPTPSPLFLLFLSSSHSPVPPHTRIPTHRPINRVTASALLARYATDLMATLPPSSPLSWTASSPRCLTHLSPRLWKHPCRPPESPLALASLLPPDSREESEPCLEPPNRAKRGQKAARCVSRQ